MSLRSERWCFLNDLILDHRWFNDDDTRRRGHERKRETDRKRRRKRKHKNKTHPPPPSTSQLGASPPTPPVAMPGLATAPGSATCTKNSACVRSSFMDSCERRDRASAYSSS
eukprot:30961-Pelagococcus_subviridis.AAC.10